MPQNFIELQILFYSPNNDKLRKETCSQLNKKERKILSYLMRLKIAF
jgi:hypothetical protein